MMELHETPSMADNNSHAHLDVALHDVQGSHGHMGATAGEGSTNSASPA